MAGAVTGHLELLFDELRTNQGLRAEFVTNPANAIAPFELTGHERHAVIKRDCDDFVALEIVSSTSQLPDVLGCPGGGGGGVDISDLLDAVRARLEELVDWRPRIPGREPPFPPKPDPEPEPRPGPGPFPGPRPRPGPRPGPTPGPDPPDPDRPSGGPDRPDRPDRPGGGGG
jgi:hypothetical protein